jgi:hypothetical protein
VNTAPLKLVEARCPQTVKFDPIDPYFLDRIDVCFECAVRGAEDGVKVVVGVGGRAQQVCLVGAACHGDPGGRLV